MNRENVVLGLSSNMWGNELLGGGLRSECFSRFYVLCVCWMFYFGGYFMLRKPFSLSHFPRQPILGPALPPGFCRAPYENDGDNDDEGGDAFLGPALPPGYKADPSSSEDEDVIGPMPSSRPNEDSLALDFERRAQRMKEKLAGEVSVAHNVFFLNQCACTFS